MIVSSVGGVATKVVCKTKDDILEAFDGPYTDIEVAPGYYDFGSWTAVTIGSDRRIRFVGDVTFKNAHLRTTTYTDSDHYDSSSSTVAWDGTDSFDKTGGGNFSATTGWEMFVRDMWFTHSSSTTTTFLPNEVDAADYAYGLTSAHDYILCKPTKNIHVEGSLTVEVPAATGFNRYAAFYGLAYCDMSRWELRFIDGPADFSSFGVVVSHCADCLLPAFEVIDYECEGAFAGESIRLQYSHRCNAYNWRVGNSSRDETTNDQAMLGIRLAACYGCRIVDAMVAGVSRYNSNVGTPDACSFYIDSNSDYNYMSGQSLAPYSEDGAESHSLNYGTGNVLNIEGMAA